MEWEFFENSLLLCQVEIRLNIKLERLYVFCRVFYRLYMFCVEVVLAFSLLVPNTWHRKRGLIWLLVPEDSAYSPPVLPQKYGRNCVKQSCTLCGDLEVNQESTTGEGGNRDQKRSQGPVSITYPGAPRSMLYSSCGQFSSPSS